MKKSNLIILSIISTLLSSCNSNIPSSESSSTTIIEEKDLVVSRIVENENKNYILVDDKPFLYNGIQIRVDWLMNEQGETIEEMEQYFEIAASLGVKMVEIPLRWKDLEPKKDAYNFRNVAKFMQYAKKYNLRIEFLLFGINIGGMTGNAPDYIKNDKVTYPQYKNNLNHPDALFFIQNNKNTLERETKATSALMDSIYQWAKTNEYNPVVAIQVRNEPDFFVTRRETYELKDSNGNQLTEEAAYKENLEAIEAIGKAIKDSKYKVVTRVNICCYNEHPAFNMKEWKDICGLESIDIVGEDTYNTDLRFHKKLLLDMKNTDNVKIPQIAENKGGYDNTNSFFLMANMLGAGYNIYDMITPLVITDDWGYADWGMLDNKTKEPKSSYLPAKEILEGINKANYLFPIVSSKDIAVFNLETRYAMQEISQEIQTSKTKYEFYTNTKALAFAINHNDYIYLYATNNSNIKISSTTLDNKIEEGYINDNLEFVVEKENTLNSNNINLEAKVFYRVKTTNLSSLQSNTIEKICGGENYE